MSDLKVYWPEEESVRPDNTPACKAATAGVDDPDEPAIYSFVEWAERLRSPFPNAALLRARQLRCSEQCPNCRRAAVLPLMLNDGRIDNSGQLVPGTATLVGFRCQRCFHEWSA